MKTTATFGSALRAVPALCLLAASLLAASPAVAAENEAPAPGVQAPVLDPVAEEIAVRVRDKARFAANIAPAVSRIMFDSGEYYRRGFGSSTEVIDALWDLRFTPALQKKWLDKLTAAAKAPDSESKHETDVVREFFMFIEEARRFTQDTSRRRPGTIWTTLRGMARSMVKGENLDDPAVKTRNEIAARLAMVKAREKAFAQAVELTDFAMEAGISPYTVLEHSALFMRVKNTPAAVDLAVSILRNDNIPERRANMMLRKLPEDIDAARKDLADLEKNMEAESRYMYALHDEGDLFLVQMPLAAILPGAEKALENTTHVPLSATADKKPEKSLIVTQLAQLVKDPRDFSAKDGKMPNLSFLRPFLRKDERLFLITMEPSGVPVFRGTALDAFSAVGPKVVELTAETADFFAYELTFERGNLGYFVAAACGPEELAAHLASLSVMTGEREKSLFGPIGEAEEGSREYAARRIKGELPKDAPGETLRMTKVDEQSLFLVLAPLADETGLARLMGPIRGVWARSYGRFEKTPWTEIRYSGKGDAGTLGTSPVLKLDKAALDALLAFAERTVIQSWSDYRAREEARNAATPQQLEERYATALADMEKRFADLNAKGFVSPMDKSGAIYYMDEAGDDAAKREKLQAILDDTSVSPAKRVAAMRKALRDSMD